MEWEILLRKLRFCIYFLTCLNIDCINPNLGRILYSGVALLGCSILFFEAIDDIEWPGASIQITLQPTPPSIDFMYYANADLLIAFHCDCQVSHIYKYKFLKATTSNIPSGVIRDNQGSKLTIDRGGLLKGQHLVSVSRSSASHTHIDYVGY
ncbi:hypothetical protein UlMin_004655 [Ulmus minor]